MAVSLTINTSVRDAQEAKRAVAHLFEKINLENSINDSVKLEQRHIDIIHDLVTKFNNKLILIEPLKRSLLKIYYDAVKYAVNDDAEKEARQSEIRKHIARLTGGQIQ